ncbi:hypothetical protein HWV62_15998 [Athelia sp. TMB]|nr:hypothetical protein HWV62_15998 [Athelia sp. TMB]
MATGRASYTHGHHESVLRSHSWRTAANSAAYLLPHIQPDMKILDVGCGPGTITADLAVLVPRGHVTGIEYVPGILEAARTTANTRGLTNIDFAVADAHDLHFPDAAFDIVHGHQVLQHFSNPVEALREMRRVAKPGGLVAVRSIDFSAMTWYPEVEGLRDWSALHNDVSRANGGEPDAGRRLHAWAHEAGYEWANITVSTDTWCFQTPEDRAWWSGLWAERVLSSTFAKGALEGGYATQQQLDGLSQAWTNWGAREDGWFAVLHGEILCRV